MRKLGEPLLALIFMTACLALLAFACGITPGGIVGGQWSPSDDHPTNYADTVLHP